MPELPEVETIKTQLNKKIRDKKIKLVEIHLGKILQGVSEEKFKKIVTDKKIKNIERRAKLIIINLSGGFSIVVHLKMTGQLLYFKNQQTFENYQNKKGAHFVYNFTDGSLIAHLDTRQFGYVKILKTKDLDNLFKKEAFGPEPLAKNFTLKVFKNLLTKRPRTKIKPLLMDQAFIAGVGNIYAQEACWAAKIFPTRTAQSLTSQEVRALYLNLIKILCLAVSCRGSSVDNYLDTEGKQGEYVPRLKVYNREGERCYRGDGVVKKMTLAGRGTYYCPNCQK
ncbi:MAG: DNA-formamidopyrimidine glycosylase [Patescibacteria group bacterium]|nr:DNA-formamidopyrimidine glycosylase [Patescibacteria group bacterium]MDD5396003.1 DNA-formamidopyrimidine glycosylase [Patescibacteria group bacterium]